MILVIRTDKPEAEVGLLENGTQIAYEVWEAHRMLAETLHTKIEEILKLQGKTLQSIKGIIVYKGPGSFTGLRIGLSVANALAYSLQVPIVGETNDWIQAGLERLSRQESDTTALPDYGAPVHITSPKK